MSGPISQASWLVTYYFNGLYGYVAIQQPLSQLSHSLDAMGLGEAHLVRVDAI